MHKYIWYCESCRSVRFDTSDIECHLCKSKMEDIGFVETIEDAIWWGQKHPNVAISPSVDWELRNGYFGKTDKKFRW